MNFLKKHMEIWYILQTFWKDGFSNKIVLEYDFSYIIRKHGILFSRKYDIFSTDGKWNMIFLKNTDGISFSYKYEITLQSKKQKRSFPEKYI